MTQEEKELLLNDISARLPHGVICQFIWTYNNETTDGEDVVSKENDSIRGIDIRSKEVQADYYGEWVDLEDCKPYLRPMSSMTGKETNEWHEKTFGQRWITFDNVERCVDWLNKNMFDYRDLIEKGLALEAPEGMYKIK